MLIGVVGFMGSGKGTVSDMLVEDYGYRKLAFADTLKDATAAIFGWDRALLEGDTKESREFREKVDEWWSARLGVELTPRYAMQLIGTEAGRNVFGENLWVSACFKKIQPNENVVIADVRYPNEVEAVRNAGGKVIRVIRGPEPLWYQTAYNHMIYDIYKMHEDFPDVHSSEWAWIGQVFDLVIDNNGSLDETKRQVKDMLRIFKKPAILQYQL